MVKSPTHYVLSSNLYTALQLRCWVVLNIINQQQEYNSSRIDSTDRQYDVLFCLVLSISDLEHPMSIYSAAFWVLFRYPVPGGICRVVMLGILVCFACLK